VSKWVTVMCSAGALALSACVTRTVTLTYAPQSVPQQVAVAPSVRVAVGDFSDNRHEPPKWIGAIRGGYGNPLKTLDTDKTVAELVADAFRQALIRRGLFAEDGRFVLSGWIDKLDGDQYARKEATAQLHVSVMDRSTRHEVFSRPASANQIEGSLMTMKSGVFGSVDELRSLIERVLSASVDSFVDSSQFRDSIQSSTRSFGPTPALRESIHVGMPLIDLTAVAPKPLSAVDKVDASGKLIGKTFTYDNGTGQLLLVTVENAVITSIELSNR
jgi:hypothetical protein